MWNLVKTSWRELFLGRRRLVLPGIALTIAIASLFLFRSFETLIKTQISNEGRSQLGGDLAIEAFRDLPEPTLAAILSNLPRGTQISKTLEFNTMLQAKKAKESRFVRLMVVDSAFPFYSNHELSNKKTYQDLNFAEPSVIVPEDLSVLLGLHIGDFVQIGETNFRIVSLLLNSKNSLGSFLSFAPTVWIHERHLNSTHLLDRPGRVSYEYHIKLNETSRDPREIRNEIKKEINDPAFRVTTYNEAERGFQTIFDQVTLFAQLVTVAALLLSGFAVFGAFQNWLYERRYLFAVLRSLGAARAQIQLFLLSSVATFSLIFCALGLLLGYFAFEILVPQISELLQISLQSRPGVGVFLFSAVCGLSVPFLFSMFALLGANDFKPILLLRNQELALRLNRKHILLALGILLALWCFQFFILRDLLQSTVLTIALLFILAAGSLISWAMLAALSRLPISKLNIAILFPIRMLLRERPMSILAATLFFVLALILGAITSLEGELQSEFRVENSVRQSSLFIFDLGESEKNSVEAALSNKKNVRIDWAPWIRVRWKQINGKALSPEQQTEDGRFNSEFLVSEASSLPERERLVQGKFWSNDYDSEASFLPEVSLTREFARRYQVEIGDRLGFEIYGVPFEAKVSNFRIVRWTEFQPGFRILFQKGVFEDLPFSYLGAVEAEGLKSRLDIRETLNRELPAVSLVDIAQIKSDLTRILGNISAALKGILGFLLILGISMIAVLAQEKVLSRERDFAVLRCVGASASQLQIFLILELVLLAFVPSVIGVTIGLLFSKLMLFYYFNIEGGEWSASFGYIPLGILILVTFVAWIASYRSRKVRPRQAFQGFGRD
ncbi:MAG: FtsX-like permease family protein [Deltaproteobacteria bacterium]|nr:FtsX-like permease family protein [Deltaproteobacteria bacterium]